MSAKAKIGILLIGIAIGSVGMYIAQFPLWQFMMFSNQVQDARFHRILIYQAELWNHGKAEMANDIFVSNLMSSYSNYVQWHPELNKRDQDSMKETAKAIEEYVAKWPSSNCSSEAKEDRFKCEMEINNKSSEAMWKFFNDSVGEDSD